MGVLHVLPSSREPLLHIIRSEEIMDSHSHTEVEGKARSSYRRHFVLVHGAGFGGWCWYKLANHLLVKSRHTVRVSSLDLGGGGIDSRDADHISTLDDYNQPLADFLRALPSDDKDITLTDSLVKKFPLRGEAITYTNESYGGVLRVYVVSKDDKLIVEELQRKFIAANPPQLVYEIEGSDHCAFFSKSEDLGEILLQIANKYTCN